MWVTRQRTSKSPPVKIRGELNRLPLRFAAQPSGKFPASHSPRARTRRSTPNVRRKGAELRPGSGVGASMNTHSGRTTSVWMATATRPEFPALTANAQADVCVVGAGMAGLSTAYLLTRAGKSVIVLDDGPIVSGETERTTAHLVNALDDRFFELERLHGEKGARLAAESHSAAIDTIERIVREEGIDCDFARLDGYLFNAPGESADLLDRELAAA